MKLRARKRGLRKRLRRARARTRVRSNPEILRRAFQRGRTVASAAARKSKGLADRGIAALQRRVPAARRLPQWGFYALGAALFGGLLWFLFRNRIHAVDVLQQADARWSHTLLGHSTENTIGEAGCFLTALTMAVNTFTKDTLTPDIAQDTAMGVNPKSFVGADLDLEIAADALGVSAPESERVHDPSGSDDDIRKAVDHALSKGGMAIVHVSLARDGTNDVFSPTGKHFILVRGRKGGSYIAADPAPGDANVELDRDTLTGVSDWGSQGVYQYKVVGAAPVYG